MRLPCDLAQPADLRLERYDDQSSYSTKIWTQRPALDKCDSKNG